MSAAQATAQNADSIVVVVVLLATALVVFWRTVIKLAIAILAVGLIALVSFGAIVIWQSMQHVVR
jgi:hypothetical protein